MTVSNSSWLIVGLGNPGVRYEATRHNIGFRVVEELTRAVGVEWRTRFEGRNASGLLHGKGVQFLCPETYMNGSGRSVLAAAHFFKTPPERVLVVHDELDLPFGRVRLKLGGGDGGHRGLRSISEQLGGKDYFRLRIGIGRPPEDFRGKVADFVLQAFAPFEESELGSRIELAHRGVAMLLQHGRDAAQKEVNTEK